MCRVAWGPFISSRVGGALFVNHKLALCTACLLWACGAAVIWICDGAAGSWCMYWVREIMMMAHVL
eukprot:3266186-Pyramimonas_sp.AAC.1